MYLYSHSKEYIYTFLTAIWMPRDQLWAILKWTAAPTQC